MDTGQVDVLRLRDVGEGDGLSTESATEPASGRLVEYIALGVVRSTITAPEHAVAHVVAGGLRVSYEIAGISPSFPHLLPH